MLANINKKGLQNINKAGKLQILSKLDYIPRGDLRGLYLIIRELVPSKYLVKGIILAYAKSFLVMRLVTNKRNNLYIVYNRKRACLTIALLPRLSRNKSLSSQLFQYNKQI